MKKITIDNKTIEISDESYEELKKSLLPSGRWKPEKREDYWMIGSASKVISDMWYDYPTDRWQYSQGNCFKTEAEAKEHLKYLEALATIREDANEYEFTEEEMNWEGVYFHDERKLSSNHAGYIQTQGTIYFPSEEAIKNSQEVHREEWLRVLGVSDA